MQLPLSKVPANIKEIEQMKKRKRRFGNNEVRAWATYAVRHPLQTLKVARLPIPPDHLAAKVHIDIQAPSSIIKGLVHRKLSKCQY